ncbi:hypothetical protein [Kineococcus rhizosphaerae]|uniref:Uncharacterized protein n=1 Tax=Kineococcus rhizosphaerae TaxID=559628 RepID=A0A2T0R4S8_9ACTN|nr:hypothetical protein [Kineococcus rhizosphaerae]PRY15366.1 hypothetical protein CLV37_105294 [Kineococcus rhizosphaerae]
MSERTVSVLVAGPSGAERASRAAQLLRLHTDAGWVAMRENVLARALRTFRPSAPVRGRHELGDFFVSSAVVVDQLRRAVEAVPFAAPDTITCVTGDGEELREVTIEIVAGYGRPLLRLAGQVHTAAHACLRQLLGALAPAGERVHSHVHIGHITADPRLL